ncbi:hypothetical protein AAVH_04183 [Aphelenchoides avenae]|nr:hypothetical protein AAVH_04183 [Aphelenchus avenae]
MVVISKGDFIWIEAPSSKRGEHSAPTGARVLSSENGCIVVMDDEGNEHRLGAERRIRVMHPSSIQGVEDMIQLGDLHEAGILRNLHIRYKEKLIYTYTGTILVAMNPYKSLPIYTAENIRLYRNRRIGDLPPHIFAIADNAYANMCATGRNQCIVISGESGAGKTESTKLLLQFLAAVSGQHSWIEQQILEANPIMEAFGNAKTVRNDNSSRFGKYVEVHFNANGAIDGARIQQYLLEKSRIVSQANDERNYHIFYCMLAGLSAREKLELQLLSAADYHLLAQARTPGRDDAMDLAEIRSAMKVLLFKEPEIWSLFKILAAMLHLGNVKYQVSTSHNIENTEVRDPLNIGRVAKLLEVEEEIVMKALTTRTLVTRQETVQTRLGAAQALDVRDALVKGVYGRLFEYVVRRINDAIWKPCKPEPEPRQNHPRSHPQRTSIGLLDIFGFENLPTNSFEQLCINYANEHLQQLFVRHVFVNEQTTYEAQHIEWRRIDFCNNQNALELIATSPMSILSLVDEESIFPKGTDSTMLQKLHSKHAKNPLYVKPKSELIRSFGVNHFAGPVMYHTKGFLEKNRDRFGLDLYALVQSSKFKLFSNLFDSKNDDIYATFGSSSRIKQTLGTRFRKSLESLMAQLEACEPFFVRCIKPNDEKMPMTFDRELVLSQLRYCGMMDTIRIRKAGYSVRYDYANFVARYRVLAPKPAHRIEAMQEVRRICALVLGPDADFQLGRTKVFLKAEHETTLEQELERKLKHHATTIQKTMRAWIQRRRFERMRASAVIIQKHWRAFSQRRKYKQILLGIVRLQAVLRSRRLVAHYNHLRSVVTCFQGYCRGSLVRNELRAKTSRAERRTAMLSRYANTRDDHNVEAEAVINPDVDIDGCFDFLSHDSYSSNGHSEKRSADASAASPSCSSLPPALEAHDPFSDFDLSAYQFSKFAATYFQVCGRPLTRLKTHLQGQITAEHARRTVRQPLLQHESPADEVASLAIWINILRFMGDLPEPKARMSSGEAQAPRTPIMARIAALSRNIAASDVDKVSRNLGFESNGFSKIRRHSKQYHSNGKMDHNGIHGDNGVEVAPSEVSGGSYQAYGDSRPTTSLEKIHFIVGHGILRPDLRDEIYCQILKQLSNNPSPKSAARGWILLALCVGCFAPTERFIRYLFCFLRQNSPTGTTKYNSYVEQRLQRTLQNGTRRQPPSYAELQSTKSKKALVLRSDADGFTVNADSAITARELCMYLCEKVGLAESFGFSLFLAISDKVSSLGSGNDHVLDAISQCEQFARERGQSERNASWRLFFRKEIFAPWHDPKADAIGTSLVYEQVVRGVKYGEYRCEKEDELALLVAQQFFVDQGGPHLDVDRLDASLAKYLPDFERTKRGKPSTEKWLQLAMNTFRKKLMNLNDLTIQRVKEDVVAFAQHKWPLLFSRFYEAYKFAGPPLPKNEVIIAVNSTGVFVVDDREQILLELTFPEISAVTCSVAKRLGTDTVTIQLVGRDEYTFQSPNADDIRELVVHFVNGLKTRSKYLLVVRGHKADAGHDLIECQKGDLLILSDDVRGDTVPREQYVKVENTRTGMHGMTATGCIYVIPTITQPTTDVLETLTRDNEASSSSSASQTANGDRTLAIPGMFDAHLLHPHSLEHFAVDNFRSADLYSDGRRPHDLCRYSREPLRLPLLKKLEGRDEPNAESITSYLAIMKYMGDHPSQRPRMPVELTDIIFKAPLKYEVLRDETYCQIMKQLTDNPNPMSEQRGWELLWLCLGLFPPSKGLSKDVHQFLRSRILIPLVGDCLARLQRVTRSGQRKFPPHQVEVDAVQHRTTQIFHKVFFPDGGNEAFEVDSLVKSKELNLQIAGRLGLRSADGFALFVKIGDKVISMPENDFFFDFVHQITEWVRSSRPAVQPAIPPIFSYQVYYMRKLWIDVNPGEDRTADLVFHYHQELPKYLRGYHAVGKSDAAHIAALILRAQTRDDKQPPMQHLQRLLPDIPVRLMDLFQLITAEYSNLIEKTSADAKISFLKCLSRWPTFGSAFFEVKQSSDPTMASKLLVAINKNGVNLYNQDTKEHLISYPFTAISNWHSGNTYFHMTVGNLIKGNRLLLETTLGYKMDDLLTTYIQVMLAGLNKDANAHVEREIEAF